MNPIDIKDLAADADRIIGGLPDHSTRGPVLVTRDGEPEAVIIRHRAYAPRLHDFEPYGGGVVCRHCSPVSRVLCDVTSLGSMVEAANRHWREAHRGQR